MSAASLKFTLRVVSIACAALGVLLLIYVGMVIAGFSQDRFEAIHPFIAFYSGYLLYQAFVFRRRFSSRFVHEFISAIMCPVGFILCAGIMNGGFGTPLARAGVAICAFLFLGVIYKVFLGYAGRVLFGKEIIE